MRKDRGSGCEKYKTEINKGKGMEGGTRGRVYRKLLTLIRLKETSLFLVKQKLPQYLFNFVCLNIGL